MKKLLVILSVLLATSAYAQISITESSTTVAYQVVDCGGSGTGVTVAESLTGINIYNLTIVNCTTGISLGSDATITNVLFENNTTDIGGAGTPTEVTNYASADGDPLLNSDYSVRAGSPVIDAGTVLYTYDAFPGDYYGRKIYGVGPDIGAVEYRLIRGSMFGFALNFSSMASRVPFQADDNAYILSTKGVHFVGGGYIYFISGAFMEFVD